jgi:hypothetical protein
MHDTRKMISQTQSQKHNQLQAPHSTNIWLGTVLTAWSKHMKELNSKKSYINNSYNLPTQFTSGPHYYNRSVTEA